MNRRGFIGSLIASAVLDPDKLLWRPGARLISIPKPRNRRVLHKGDHLSISFDAAPNCLFGQMYAILDAEIPEDSTIHDLRAPIFNGTDNDALVLFHAPRDFIIKSWKVLGIHALQGVNPISLRINVERVDA